MKSPLAKHFLMMRKIILCQSRQVDRRESTNLASLLHIFKSKIRVPLAEPVQLSVRLTYSVNFPFPYSKKAVRVGKYGSLPWGCMMSPIEYTLLYATWLRENI